MKPISRFLNAFMIATALSTAPTAAQVVHPYPSYSFSDPAEFYGVDDETALSEEAAKIFLEERRSEARYQYSKHMAARIAVGAAGAAILTGAGVLVGVGVAKLAGLISASGVVSQAVGAAAAATTIGTGMATLSFKPSTQEYTAQFPMPLAHEAAHFTSPYGHNMLQSMQWSLPQSLGITDMIGTIGTTAATYLAKGGNIPADVLEDLEVKFLMNKHHYPKEKRLQLAQWLLGMRLKGQALSPNDLKFLNYLFKIPRQPTFLKPVTRAEIDRKFIHFPKATQIELRNMLYALSETVQNNKVGGKQAFSFIGEPGTGKTTAADFSSELIGIPICRINIASLDSPADLFGRIGDSSHVADPGKIVSCLRETGVNNPIIVVDDVHKVLNDPNNHLASAWVQALQTLVDKQIRDFYNPYFEIRVGIDNIIVILTTNEVIKDPTGAFADRFTEIIFTGFTEEAKKRIVTDRLATFLKSNQNPSYRYYSPEDFSSELNYLLTKHAQTHGVRQLLIQMENRIRFSVNEDAAFAEHLNQLSTPITKNLIKGCISEWLAAGRLIYPHFTYYSPTLFTSVVDFGYNLFQMKTDAQKLVVMLRRQFNQLEAYLYKRYNELLNALFDRRSSIPHVSEDFGDWDLLLRNFFKKYALSSSAFSDEQTDAFQELDDLLSAPQNYLERHHSSLEEIKNEDWSLMEDSLSTIFKTKGTEEPDYQERPSSPPASNIPSSRESAEFAPARYPETTYEENFSLDAETYSFAGGLLNPINGACIVDANESDLKRR